jgi:hypothetical protein
MFYKRLIKMHDDVLKNCCTRPDYESKYYQQQERIKELIEENEQLKKALVKIALKL